jgi:hypothetical protein
MPEIDMDELEQLQTPDGADTEESRRYVRQIKSDRKKLFRIYLILKRKKVDKSKMEYCTFCFNK